MGAQETIIYRLVMSNGAYFSFLNFWREMGVAHWVDLSSQSLSRNHVFDIFRGDLPPPLRKYAMFMTFDFGHGIIGITMHIAYL